MRVVGHRAELAQHVRRVQASPWRKSSYKIKNRSTVDTLSNASCMHEGVVGVYDMNAKSVQDGELMGPRSIIACMRVGTSAHTSLAIAYLRASKCVRCALSDGEWSMSNAV